MRKKENEVLAKKINDCWIFEPKIEDPLDDVIEIIDLLDIEHKKSMFLYVESTVQLPDEIEETQKLIDGDFIDLQTKFDKVNDVATEQKKQKKIEDTIESIIDDKNPLRNFDNFWWEDDLFNAKDSQKTVEAFKNILGEMQEMSNNIFRNIRPVDYRTVEEKIEDDLIPIDDRTWQELEDDDYNNLESDIETEEIDTITPNLTEEEIDTTTAWDPNQTEAAKPGPIIKLSTDYNKKIKVANKIKN